MIHLKKELKVARSSASSSCFCIVRNTNQNLPMNQSITEKMRTNPNIIGVIPLVIDYHILNKKEDDTTQAKN